MVSTTAPEMEVKEKTFQPPSSQWVSLARDRWVRYPVGDAGLRRLQELIATPARVRLLMAVEIRVFLAIDAFSGISGTVFAFGVRLFVLLAKQTLDSAHRAFGDDVANDPIVRPSIIRSPRKTRFLTAKIERIPAAANTFACPAC